MTELICWPLDNKQYTSVALGAAYAARSRGVLNADSFAAKTNGNNTVTVGKGVGCIHVSDQWAAFPFSQGDVTLTFTIDSDKVTMGETELSLSAPAKLDGNTTVIPSDFAKML